MTQRILLIIFLVSISSLGFAQRPVSVSYKYDKTTEKYIFEAKNSTNEYITLVVYFNRLSSLNASTTLPAVKTIRTGTTRLFTLEKMGTNTPSFDYGWVYWFGTHNAKVKDVQYLLPTTAGTKIAVFNTNTVKDVLGQKDDTDYYGLAFKLVDGDTITAIRKGIVEAIQQENQTDTLKYTYTKNRNFLKIRHEDGTVARYSNFRNESVQVSEGDEVNPGDPLAIATQTNQMGDATLLITVSHLHIDPDDGKNYRDWSSNKYVRPKFKTKNYEGLLEPGKTYISTISTDLITQEMGKREKKKYLKSSK
ncbi:M23 family metallopeptidase [Roseivirga spongicola]|jgi:murein DD-endopeptidase MepM/ murein hydrolase activator NlpD|uniref:M23 family metallopeptidase n=1 Tax=Roseivirga spongicola TaxID=333140 RepID=UPI002AC9BBC8|nr:M23 family metallopeptidase [Roseivirga spongicola]WPZ11584.1 M23 family metallopeptidase [Roseivirga spongicola]